MKVENLRSSTPKQTHTTLCLARFGLSALIPLLGWAQVNLSPGSNIQTDVDQNPAGTTFIINGGTYRLQSIQPKDGDTFLGMPGAILNGSMVLSSWTPSGSVWVDASGFTTPSQQNGSCDAKHPMCAYPEDLFYDNIIQLRKTPGGVTVGCGCWSLDYSTGNVTVGNDPSDHTVEMSVTRSAFSGPATNVTISGITVEKYANLAQNGSIGYGSGTGWTVTNTELRYNHGDGIELR